MKVFACSHLSHPDGTVLKECRACPDAEAKPARHLLMHLWPVAGNGVWQLRVKQLKQRWHLFDGVKAVAVVLDSSTDSLAAVQAEFADPTVQFISLPNNAGLREMASWPHLWEQLKGQRGHVFFCHGKQTRTPLDAKTGVHLWTEMMFAAALDYWPLVEETLKTHTFAGSFRRVRQWGGSTWYYSGSFYWARLDHVGERWREADIDWYGVEPWPGKLVNWRGAGCLFCPRILYEEYGEADMQRITALRWGQWREANEHLRTKTLTTV